ncbi:pre-peptidase C-terminal domain-containing protein [Kamptonema formosum]|uniref:pre-peptidase C-terminal domain-containing protein n=1 Tax=Kamptonema formosum TaxID=331992 RepID=UPI00034CBACE|nr:pre-peptidase C-terminal domain-containing protein [Oscillatoria sp. PCC 10802]
MLDTNALFDESFYLAQNQDVAQAVSSGGFSSGLEHFQEYGKFEKRDPSALFDTTFYLEFYSDVATAVEKGQVTAIDHFVNNGQFEKRDTMAEFYTDDYIANNPDVAAAVQASAGQKDPLTGMEHFVKYGQYENRNFGPDFDTGYYMQQNPDVAKAVSPGGLSAIKHYRQFGIEEGRQSEPPPPEISLSAAESLGTLGSATRSGFVGNASTEKIYSFTLNTASTVTLSLNGLSADADLALIEDSNSNGVVDEYEPLDASSAEGAAPEEISSLLSPGTYYVLVEQFEGDTNYNLSLSATPFTPPADTAGNTLNTATDLGTLSSSKTLNEFVGDADEQDVYHFTLSESRNLSVNLQDLSADADLKLIQDTNGNGVADENEEIESSASPGNAAEAIATNALPAGTYFIAVNKGDGDTTYNLSLSVSAPTPPPSPPARTPDSALTAAKVENSAKFSETGQVSASKSDSYYSFTVGESGIFTADLTGLTGDADVRLIRDFNGNGQVDPVADRNGNGFIDDDEIEVVAWQWERGTGNESIRAFLQPSTSYFLQVKSFNQQTANYTVSTDFTPAASDLRKFSIDLNFGEGTQDLTETERNTIRQAAHRIEQLISYSTFEGPHTIRIDATAKNQDANVLASAGPRQVSVDLNRREMAIVGEASLNSNPQSDTRANQRFLYDTMIHEFAHVLGIGTLWEDRNLIADSKKGLYKQDSYAGTYYGELLGTFSETPVELTVGEGEGSDLGHWRKIPDFDIEIMVESGSKDEKQLTSQLTVATLRDIGFNVNYGAAQEYSLPSQNSQLVARQNGSSQSA